MGATFPVRFELPAAGTQTNAIARDVSLGGMFVVTESPADEGTLLLIELDLEGVKVSVDARVLRREADGMAVAFIDLPDDVATILSAAVTPTSSRTILGVGSGSLKATTPGVAVPPSDPHARVAVPSVNTTTPGIAAPKIEKRAPVEKPKPKVTAKAVEPEEKARESSVPPPPKSGGGGRWLLFLLLCGGGVAAYLYREPLRREIENALGPNAPAPAPTPTVAPSIDASAVDASPSDASSVDASSVDASSLDASSPKDAGGAEAGGHDGGARDGGAHDAGARDAGHRDGGSHK